MRPSLARRARTLVRSSLARHARRLGASAPAIEPVRKLLIANRGEIACRVVRTARRLGIETVAIYSDADRGAMHVELADEAVRVGAPPSAQSYLDQAQVLGAVRATGADAVFPGYGFLSENAEFAAAVEALGARFVGPPPGAIAAMGDKIESKRIAAAAGVNVIPGFDGEVREKVPSPRGTFHL
jgi:propionyl-CoA carboxylase alpha chain